LILNLNLQLTAVPARAQHAAALTHARAQRWVANAINTQQVQHAELTVRVVNASEGRALNRHYRGKDYATNVLTFDYARHPVLQADLVLCAPVLAREAQQLRKPLHAHYAHLLVHGTLHAQGYDHEHNEADADEMEALEALILHSLGFDNPYPPLD
jgi:probable rRNA maturation factor